jgi:uncharacterized membrane protein
LIRLIRLALRLAPLAALGAWLANRALDTRGEGRELPSIRAEVEVDAPIERVWAVLADIERQPDWMHDLKAVELTTAPPHGVGTRGIGRVRAYGITVSDPVEITAFEPPVLFGLRHDGFVRGKGTIRLEVIDRDSTRVRWEEQLVPRILPALGATILATAFRPIYQRDLVRLAELVEARERGVLPGAPPDRVGPIRTH